MFTPGYLLLTIFLMIIMGIASRNVQATFRRYSEVPIRRRMTGAQTARFILDRNGLQNIAIEPVAGELTDHYDPRGKVLRLSQPVYNSASVSAVGVAAHEAGHALQDKSGYWPLIFRQSFYPMAAVGSNLGMVLIMIGLFTSMAGGGGINAVAILGILLYGAGVLLTVVTLPVEFNASRRALAELSSNGIISQEEYGSTRKVLSAAAMTYVAAAVGAILTLLYYVSLFTGGSRDE